MTDELYINHLICLDIKPFTHIWEEMVKKKHQQQTKLKINSKEMPHST